MFITAFCASLLVIGVSVAISFMAPDRQRNESGHGAEALVFGALDEMIAASDAVVLGRIDEVAAAEPDESSGGDGVSSITMRLVVDRLVRGELDGPQRDVALEEQRVRGGGDTIEVGDLSEGDQGLFFLWRRMDREEAVYRMVNAQGFVLFDDTQELSQTIRTGRHDELSPGLERQDPGTLVSRVEDSDAEPGMDKESIITPDDKLEEYEREERGMREDD